MVLFYQHNSLDHHKMPCHLMKNKLASIDNELEKDHFKGLEMRELNDTEKFI